MSMASAYGNAMAPRRSESFLPLLSKGRGGGGSGGGGAAVDLKRDMFESQESQRRAVENEIRGRYGGRISTPEQEQAYLERTRTADARGDALEAKSIAMADKEYAREQAELNAARSYHAGERGYKDKRADVAADRAMKGREVGVKEGELGIKQGTAERAWETHDRSMDIEAQMEEHHAGMNAFYNNDARGVMEYLLKTVPDGAVGEDGAQQSLIPDVENVDGQWMVRFPGSDEAVQMAPEEFEGILTKMSPKFMTPTSDKAMADTELTRATADSKGALSNKDRIADAKNRADTDLEGYQSPFSGSGAAGVQAPAASAQPRFTRPTRPGDIQMGPDGKKYTLTEGGKLAIVNEAAPEEMSANEYQSSGLADEARAMGAKDEPKRKPRIQKDVTMEKPKVDKKKKKQDSKSAMPGKTANEIQSEKLRKGDSESPVGKYVREKREAMTAKDREKSKKRREARKKRQGKKDAKGKKKSKKNSD